MVLVSLSELNNKGTASGVHQWDLSQQIDLSGTDVTDCVVQWVYDTLPPGTTTDNRSFSLRSGDDDFTDGGIVDIPDVALMQTGEITGYIYYNGTETIGSIVVNPIPREQPADYVSPDNTVTLQDLIDTAVDAAIPTFEIGDVEAGEAPAAALTETETGYALDLTLQTGATGPQGPQGVQGPAGAQGPMGPTGPAGADGESIDVVEISEADYLAIETPNPATLYLVDCTIHVISVALDSNAEALAVLATVQLTASILPLNAEDKSVVWSSSDEDVATVDQEGLVTAVGTGAAVITVTTNDGGYTATCNIEAAEDLPELWSGTRIGIGPSVTISGNRVTINGTMGFNITWGWSSNTPNPLAQPSGTWVTLAAGDKIKLVAKYVSGSKNITDGLCGLRLHPYALAQQCQILWSDFSAQGAEAVFTASGATDVTGLYGGANSNNTFTNYVFDIEVYYMANGETEYARWI